MNVKIVNESGYEAAIRGIGFSYGIDDFKRLQGVAKKLAFKDGGHNKFLESIVVWVEICAARYWWQEFDTYRISVTKQSECFDDKTEILTDYGWKLFKELENDDLVCTMSIDNRNIEYQKPISYIEQEYNGKMVSIQARSLDLIVTPNHRMLVKRRRNEGLRTIYAEAFTYSHAVPKQSKWCGKEKIEIVLPEIVKTWKIGNINHHKVWNKKTIHMDLWLEFMGIWLSEGYVCKGKKGNYIVSVCQAEDGRYTPKIDDLFDKLPFHVCRYVEKREKKKSIVIWRIYNKQLYDYLLPLSGAKNKCIPHDLLQLSQRQLSILNDWLMAGDGCTTCGHYIYISISKSLIDDVQELWIKLGYSSRIRIHNKAKGNCKTVYSIARHKTKYAYALKEKITKVDYQGKIYCVEVSNHIVLVRRNGKIAWSGNSTIHTIAKRPLTQNDFEHEVFQSIIDYVNSLIVKYNKSEDASIKKQSFNLIKANLPEGYLQKRMVCTNYKTLGNMIYQRKNHRLQEWHIFIEGIRKQLKHPELLFKEK